MGRVAQTPLAAVGLLTLLLAALPRPLIMQIRAPVSRWVCA
jgi:hypothetical protein